MSDFYVVGCYYFRYWDPKKKRFLVLYHLTVKMLWNY